MPDKTIPDNCQTVAETAEYLHVSTITVRRLIKSKKLKASRVARRVRITPAAIVAYLDAQVIA